MSLTLFVRLLAQIAKHNGFLYIRVRVRHNVAYEQDARFLVKPFNRALSVVRPKGLC